MTLDDLIAQLEKAEGQSRELDAQIWAGIHGGYIESNDHHGAEKHDVVWYEDNGWKRLSGFAPYYDRKMLGDARDAPAYSSSIDAALTLVPEGGWTLWHDAENGFFGARVGSVNSDLPFEHLIQGHSAKSPAIALCIAALKARKEQP